MDQLKGFKHLLQLYRQQGTKSERKKKIEATQEANLRLTEFFRPSPIELPHRRHHARYPRRRKPSRWPHTLMGIPTETKAVQSEGNASGVTGHAMTGFARPQRTASQAASADSSDS